MIRPHSSKSLWESIDIHEAPPNFTALKRPAAAMAGNASRSMLPRAGSLFADFCEMQYMPAFIQTPGTTLFSKNPVTRGPSVSTVP